MNSTDAFYQYQLFPELAEDEYSALKDDIARRGVLVAVEKDEEGNILDGFHRVRICKELGIEDYPVAIRVGLTHQDKIEHALSLNLNRRNLTREQRQQVVLKLRGEGWSSRRIADKLQVDPKTVRNDLETHGEYSPPEAPALIQGKDGKSYPAHKPRTILTATPGEAAQVQQALTTIGDEPIKDTGLVTGQQVITAARLHTARQRVPEPSGSIPLPTGSKYRCIVIDPPWPMEKIERDTHPDQGVKLDYPVMSLDDIAALPVADLADLAGCHVYLWTTHKFTTDAFRLMSEWGARYQCLMTWVKPTGFTPYSWMYNTEHVLFGRFGSLGLKRMGLKLSFEAPVIRHSQKPDVFYERVVQASPGPRLEMFARTRREGFDSWGNEVATDVA